MNLETDQLWETVNEKTCNRNNINLFPELSEQQRQLCFDPELFYCLKIQTDKENAHVTDTHCCIWRREDF